MELDDRDALLDPSLRGVGTGNVSGGNEENNIDMPMMQQRSMELEI